jgi:cytochrome P450
VNPRETSPPQASALPRRRAPGPRGRPLVGSYFELQRDPLAFLVRCSRDYGHVVRIRPFAGLHWHFLSHPDHLEHLLQRHHANYPKGLYARLVSLAAGEGLVALEGDRWLRQRRLMQPAFHRRRLAGLAATMTSTTAEMLQAWDAHAGGPLRIDATATFSRLTLAIVGRALIGIDISGETDAFGRAFKATLAYLNFRLTHPFAMPIGVPTPRNVQYRRAVTTLNALLDPLVRARRDAGTDTGDLLSMLLDARDEQGEGMSDHQVREEVKTLLTAGHETTGATLFWCVYLLARHPDQERRVHAEVDAIGREPEIEDLPRLAHTRRVIEESMRLYPGILWLGRVATAADEIGGYHVAAGGRVIFSSYVTHRHPDFWERPDDFDPDRFAPDRVASRPRGAYLPFGMGPRHCIGDQFAMMEAQLVLASIARRYRLRLERDEPVQPEILATLRPPAGVMMRVEAR